MERDVFSIKETRLSYGRGYAYSLQYHLVWCTKYRKKVDHIHLLVDCRPQFFISDMIKIMKGNLARQMFLATSGIKTGTVGRSFVESILLRSDGQRSKQGAGTGLYRKPKGKRKQQKTEIQKRKLREMIVCRLHPVMA